MRHRKEGKRPRERGAPSRERGREREKEHILLFSIDVLRNFRVLMDAKISENINRE